MVKTGDSWRECDWEEALDHAAVALRAVVEEHGGAGLGALGSSSATLEELYLLQKLARGLGSSNVDHRLRQGDFSDQDAFPPVPGLGMPLADVEANSTASCWWGPTRARNIRCSTIACEKSVISLAARSMAWTPSLHEFNYPVADSCVAAAFGRVRRPACRPGRVEGRHGEHGLAPQGCRQGCHPAWPRCHEPPSRRAHPCSRLWPLPVPAEPPWACCWKEETVPVPGLPVPFLIVAPLVKAAVSAGLGCGSAMISKRTSRAYLFLGVEPELDCGDSASALSSDGRPSCVVALTAFDSPRLREHAHVMLAHRAVRRNRRHLGQHERSLAERALARCRRRVRRVPPGR